MIKTITAQLVRELPVPAEAYTVDEADRASGIHNTIDYRGELFTWYARQVGGDDDLPLLRFYEIESGGTIELPIPEAYARWPPDLQPFPGEARLLVHHTALDNADRNAHVYGPTGEELVAFHAGHFIEQLRVTPSGNIWLGYYDQGIYDGNRLSANGLVCLSGDGQPLFTYNSLPETLPTIDDCYALNVVNDHETWAYYYYEFPLVKIVDFHVVQRWDARSVAGAHAFAVHGGRVLFAGDYDHDASLFLFDLSTTAVEELQPIDASGNPIAFSMRYCMGGDSRLYLRTGGAVYVVDLKVLG